MTRIALLIPLLGLVLLGCGGTRESSDRGQAINPASTKESGTSPSGAGLPKTVCEEAKKKLKKAKKSVKKAKDKSAKEKARRKVKEAKGKVGKQCLKVTSTAFRNGETIPRRFTCDGANVSPPLAWQGAEASAAGLPKGTLELALLVEDPDAPARTFVHWVLYGIGAGTTSIAQNSVPPGALQGANSFGTSHYGGPCPPPGDGPHRYFFTVFALSSPLGSGPNATAAQVRSAAQGNTKASGTVMGRYER